LWSIDHRPCQVVETSFIKIHLEINLSIRYCSHPRIKPLLSQ
jgi:hypothetical protein